MTSAGALLTARVRLLLLVALVLAGLGALFAATGRSDAATLTSYHYKAHLVIDQQVEAAQTGFPNDQPLDTVEGWYQAPDKWALNIADSQRPTAGSQQVADGAYVWYYDRPTNTYSRASYAFYYHGRSPNLEDGPPPVTGAFFIGAFPYNDPERLFAAFAGQHRSESDGGIVAGRPTRAVTFTSGERHVTFWIDREFSFVLKYVAHDATLSVSVEAVEVSFNEALPGTPFVFEPPPGAREVPPPPGGPVVTRGSGSAGGNGQTDVPDGFLRPSYTPSGYRETASAETSGIGGQTTYIAHRYQPDGETDLGGDYLLVEEQYRAGGLAPSQMTGSPVALGASTGYASRDGDVQRLVFAKGDMVVTLSSDVLPLEELIKVAAALS